MIRELGTAEGGLAAALDADSEGEEGKFYVWTPAQLRAVLGPDDGQYAAETFGVTTAGTFEHGSSVLQLRADPADGDRLARIKTALLAARAERVRPARDDKIVAAWNGLAIAALAETGLLLGRPEFIAAARGAAELLAGTHFAAGRLARTSRDGMAYVSAGVWRTTPAWLTSDAEVSDGAGDVGFFSPGSYWPPPSTGSGMPPAASTTRRTTASRCSTARPIQPTARVRPASSRRRARC
jgi:hypothetical protein